MNAIGFLRAEELLSDLGGTRIVKVSDDAAVLSEWAMPRGRIVISQGDDGRLRAYTLAAEVDRLRPDGLLDAITLLQQPRGRSATG